jgi:hypothetical protein
MDLNPYPDIINSKDFAVFDFISSGKRTIKKRVKFELIDNIEQVYNLALCTILDDGKEDCEIASRNGDMLRILETVGIIALMYTEHYPLRKIYFTGSDNLRTRQYQLSIFSRLQSIVNYFDIEGLQFKGEDVNLRESFKPGKNYDAFIFSRKLYT